ncbi:glycosyltransferase family 2 protein [Nocardioides bigeumensis]|uniref:Glycosyltransferase family 2 protein n=2 Tax=Nocardioides bigeumensis TaxID=433657 RepID=A0ABN2XUM7_9ACTN
MLNEAAVIGDVVAGLRCSFEHVICVDDGSTDKCGELARAAGARVVTHPSNLGQGAALQSGVTFALDDGRTKYIVTFDADGQHRVADADRMVEVARTSGVDIVLGSRFLESTSSGMTAARRAVLRAAVGFTRATTGLALTDAHNGLRVLSRYAAQRISLTQAGMAHASELLNQIAHHRLRHVEVPVTIDYTDYSRSRGQSNINALNILFDLGLARLSEGRTRV